MAEGSLLLCWCLLIMVIIVTEFPVTQEETLKVMGALNEAQNSSLQKGGFAEVSLASPAPSSVSWKVTSNMPDPISVHCHNQFTNLGESTLAPGNYIQHTFTLDPHYYELWFCDFTWNWAPSPVKQSFEVWAHDGRTGFLYRCWDCDWKVERDGFYLKDIDGIYYREWQWIPWNSQH